jgi:hypothetical protein
MKYLVALIEISKILKNTEYNLLNHCSHQRCNREERTVSP